MNGLYTAAVTVCASGIVCALLSAFVSDGAMKRILSLVLGVFMVCSLIMPLKNAFVSISADLSKYPGQKQITATADEAFKNRVLSQTRQNLENTLTDLLRQNGIEANDCGVVLASEQENRIIIGSICIYIGEESSGRSQEIIRLTQANFGVTPTIITE